MKKLAYLILTSILALTFIEAYSNAHASQVEYSFFEQHLEGTVSSEVLRTPDGWNMTTQQIITGIGTGTLPGSPITFTITAQIHSNEDIMKSLTLGDWKIVASDGQSSISGRFIGKGTSPSEFSGTFHSTNNTAKGNLFGKMIYGEFESRYLQPEGYAALWRYEADWTGTIKETG